MFTLKKFLNLQEILSFSKHSFLQRDLRKYLFSSRKVKVNLNPILISAPILYFLKTLENQSLAGVIRGIECEHWRGMSQSH